MTLNEKLAEWPAMPYPLGHLPPQPFPVHVLPSRLAAAVEHVVATRHVHRSLPFTAYIGCISGAFADGATVAVSHTWTMPVNVYALVVATSGDGKSPAFQPALDLTEMVDHRRCEVVAAEVVESKARFIELADEIKTAAGKGKDGVGKDPMRLRRLIAEQEQAEQDKRRTGRVSVGDATPESTAVLMSRNGGLLLAIDAEGTLVHHALGLYSSTPNMSLWLAGWSGETYKRDRVLEDGAREVIIPSARIGVGAAIQPGVLQALYNDPRADDRGFVARALVDWPPSMAGQRELGDVLRHPADPQHLDPLHSHVLATWQRVRSTTPTLTLTADARQRFVDWHDRLERGLSEGDDGHRRAVAKLRGSAPRLAAVFHLLGDDQSTVIEDATMRGAIVLVDYYLSRQAASADQAMLGDARKVLDFLATVHSGRTTVNEVTRAVRWHRHVGGAARAIAALTVLSEHGWAQPANKSGFGTPASGRPTSKVLLHPKIATATATAEASGEGGTPRARRARPFRVVRES